MPETCFLMSLAQELGKPFFEVASWPVAEILRWRVYSRMKNEDWEEERRKK